MGTQLETHGNSDQRTFGADTKINRSRAWVHVLTASTSGLEVALPDARNMGTGYPVLQIVNPGATNSYVITDADGTTLHTLTITTNNVATYALIDNSTAAGTWKWGLWDLNSAAAPAATVFPWTLCGTDMTSQESYEFDFTAATWGAAAANTPTASYNVGAGARIEGDGFICNNSLDHESFSPDNPWSVKQDQQYNRDRCYGEELSTTDDRAYYFGSGVSGDGDSTDYYDKSADSFTDVANMTASKHRNCVFRGLTTDFYAVAGTSIYAITQASNDSNYKYDSVGDAYSTKEPCGTSSVDSAHTYADSTTRNPIKYGGRDKHGGGFVGLDNVERYGIVGDAWTVRTDFTDTLYQGCATHIDENERSYVLIGLSGGALEGDDFFHHVDLSDTYTQQQDHAATSNSGRCNVMLPLTS